MLRYFQVIASALVFFLATVSCEESKDFSSLEEKAFIKEKQNEEANKPLLSRINFDAPYAGSTLSFDLNNEKVSSDDGMLYECTASQIGAGISETPYPCNGNLGGVSASSFDASTGMFAWTPSDLEIGTYQFNLIGRNQYGEDQYSLNVDIEKDNRPLLASVSNQIIERNKQFLLKIENERAALNLPTSYECFFDLEQDGKVDPNQSCQMLPGEPAIKFDSGSGILAWIPDSSAKEGYEIKINAKNSYGEDQILFAVTVIEPRDAVISLTDIRDQIITEEKLTLVDVDNEITGDDSGVSYSCRYDLTLNGKLDSSNLNCHGIPGTVAATFDTKKGMLSWQPPVDRDSIEITITGEKNGQSAQTTFAFVFSSASFGEIGNSALAFTPVSYEFGNKQVGSVSDAAAITVTNVASVDVYMQPPLIGNENFSILYSTCPISPTKFAAKATCIVGVRFHPSISASLGTTVAMNFGINSSVTNTYTTSFSVSGRGIGTLTFDGLASITNVTHNSLTLNWATTNDAVSFIVFRVNGVALEFIESALNTGGTVNSRTYSGLYPGTSYTYRVRATDVFGIADGNTKDIQVSTLPNSLPYLSDIANPTTYAGQLMSTININDTTNNNDLDADGDNIIYVCQYDNTINGSVSAVADACSTIVNQDGTNVTFNQFTGVLSNFKPKFSDTGTAFEFKITGSDPYNGKDSTIFSTTVGSGEPELQDFADLVFPNQAADNSDIVSYNLGNVRFGAASDEFMSYTCTFVRHEPNGDSASATCSTLPGVAASFNATTGVFSWTTNNSSLGSYSITFTGTNDGGSDSEVLKVSVQKPISTSDLAVHLNAAYVDLHKPGVQNPSMTNLWHDLVSGGVMGSLQQFTSPQGWLGTGLASDPYHLNFDGVDDRVDLAHSNTDGYSFELWVKPDANDIRKDKVIYSDADNSDLGITVTNLRTLTGRGPSNYRSTVLADNPALYWNFSNIAGTTVADESPNNRSGVITNQADAFAVPGTSVEVGGQSFYTRGSGYVFASDYDLNGEWSIEFWLKTPIEQNCITNNTWCVFTRGSADDFQVAVYHLTAAPQRLVTYKSTATATVYDSGFSMNSLSPGWHHIVTTAKAGTTKFYVDGTQVGSVAWTSTSNIRSVGGQHGNATRAAQHMDEFAVYTQELTPAQVLAHYQAGSNYNRCLIQLVPDYWYQIAGIVNPISNQVETYINGASYCSFTASTSPGLVNSAQQPMLGRSLMGAPSAWKGSISEARIYDSTTSTAIASNFQNRKTDYEKVIPIPFKGLVLWSAASEGVYQDTAGTVSAAANNDPVALWKDRMQHFRSADFVQANTNFQPKLVTNVLNGRPALEFDGVDDRIDNPINYSLPNTVIYVGRYIGATWGRVVAGAGNNWLMGFYNGMKDLFHPTGWLINGTGPAGVQNEWKLYMGDQAVGGYARLYSDGSLIRYGVAGAAAAPNGIRIGAANSNNQFSTCQVAEIIVYDRILTDAERLQIENYLNSVYDIFD